MARKGQGILLVYTDLIEPKYEEEFNAWYNTEHVPELLAIPGVLDAARYVATKGGPKYLAAYDYVYPISHSAHASYDDNVIPGS